jgi:hypothetical protein
MTTMDVHMIFNVIAALLLCEGVKWLMCFVIIRLTINGILGVDAKKMAAKKMREAADKIDAEHQTESPKSFSERIEEKRNAR